jgi:CRISPR-associated protein Cmr1
MMHTATYTLTFTTPAFLGDANQNARWRTPPIKHELRHWWRVAYAADHGFRVNVSEMRREEGLLFGNAWLSHRVGRRDQNTFTKSLVRLRLDKWDDGRIIKGHPLYTPPPPYVPF